MLHSNHVVMVNEAILSLSIMSATFLLGYTEEELQTQSKSRAASSNENKENEEGAITDASLVLTDPRTVSSQLHTDAVINGIKNCLKNPDHPKEVKANAASLTLTLLKTKTKDFKEMLSDLNFVTECLNEEALKNLPDECKKVHDIICSSGIFDISSIHIHCILELLCPGFIVYTHVIHISVCQHQHTT